MGAAINKRMRSYREDPDYRPPNPLEILSQLAESPQPFPGAYNPSAYAGNFRSPLPNIAGRKSPPNRPNYNGLQSRKYTGLSNNYNLYRNDRMTQPQTEPVYAPVNHNSHLPYQEMRSYTHSPSENISYYLRRLFGEQRGKSVNELLDWTPVPPLLDFHHRRLQGQSWGSQDLFAAMAMAPGPGKLFGKTLGTANKARRGMGSSHPLTKGAEADFHGQLPIGEKIPKSTHGIMFGQGTRRELMEQLQGGHDSISAAANYAWNNRHRAEQLRKNQIYHTQISDDRAAELHEIIKQQTGQDIDLRFGVHSIGNDEIIHAIKKHQYDFRPLIPNNFSIVPRVVQNGGVQGIRQPKRGTTSIEYLYNTPDGDLTVIEDILSNRGGRQPPRLGLKTMYWK